MPDTLPPAADPLLPVFLHLVETTAQQWNVAASLPILIDPDEDEEEGETRPERRRRKKENEGRGGPRLLALLKDSRLYFDPHGGTYVEIEGELFPLEAKYPLLIETLSALYYRATGQTMGKDSASAVLSVLSYSARREGQPAIMANRAAFSEGALFYDLGNHRAAKIERGAWQVVPAPAGCFRPWPHKRPHPDPIAPGDASRLFEFVNISPDDRPLVLATLAACLVPDIARPALVITGAQGSGKSTAARLFKTIIDPGTPALTMIPRKPEDLDILLCRHFFLALDNLSSIPPDVADTISGVITGAAPQRRKLHSDTELLTLHADLTLCFTSINSLSNRPDFLERTLRIQLERIEAVDRLADDELDSAIETALPGILGGLLSLLAKGLELLPSYRPSRLPRMATFARTAAAIAEALEAGTGDRYLAEFFRNQGAQHMELAEGNSFFAAILEACANDDPPEGTFKQVATKLKEIAQPDLKERFPTARGLRKEVERLRVPLETAGIGFQIDSQRTANSKASIRFFAKPKDEDLPTVPPVDPVALADLAGLVFDDSELL